jgi:TonB family protein
MRRVVLLSVLVWCNASFAYEGAGLLRVEDGGTTAPVLTQAPVLTKFVEAEYPFDALDAGQEATVELAVDLDATGKVTAAEVTQSAGPGFDAAAVAAVKQFEFTPAELDHKPASVRIAYVYHFTLWPPVPDAGELEPVDAGPPPPPPVNVRGRVLEAGTRTALTGASVKVVGSALFAETDGEGRFELRGVPPGAHQLEVVDPFHDALTLDAEVKAGELAEVTAYLKRKGSALQTTVVAQRDVSTVSEHVLEKGELSTVPGTFGDPLRVLQNMPGMARPPLISGALLVRGAQPEDTQVLIDGVPIPLLYHFGGGPSVLAPSYIDQIDFFPGAYGAKYGRAIAGIVDVETSSAPPKAFHGQASVDLLNAGFYVEAPISTTHDWGSASLAARHSLIDFVLPAITQAATRGNRTSIIATPAYWDYQGRYQVNFGKDHFELSAFGSNDALSITRVGQSQTQAFALDTDQGFHRFRIKWSRKTEDGWQLSLAPTVGFTINEFDANSTTKVSANSTDFNLRGGAKRQLAEGVTLETGIDVNASWVVDSFTTPGMATPDDDNPPPTVRKQNVNLGSYAWYTQVEWNVWHGLKLVPGVRFELYELPSGAVPSFEPRFAARYKFTDWLTAKAAWGIYRQAPQPNQLDPVTGNPDLGLSQSQQTAAGIELRPLPKVLPRLSLDVQGYFNWRTGLVTTNNSFTALIGNLPPASRNATNNGYGRAYGLEVMLKHDLTEHLYGWVAYTLSRSEQWDPTSQSYVAVNYDQTHILTVVFSYKFFSGWETGLRFRLTTGRPTTPILGATFDADSGGYAPVYGAPGSQRDATFNQLDLRVERVFTFDLWKLSVYLDVQNVYNAPNPELTLYNYNYSQSAPLRGLPFLPTLGLKGEF